MSVNNISPIAKPMAKKKLTKKCYKLVKKVSDNKLDMRRGVKEVVKSLRKGKKGLCLIAGDIFPIDVIAHLPVLCEEKEVKYVYVPSKSDLGTSANSKRPTSCLLVIPPPETSKYRKLFDEVQEGMTEEEIEF